MDKSDYPMEAEIERAVPGDAEIICDIRDRAWLEAYPNEELGISAEDIRLNAQGEEGVFVPRRIAHLEEQLKKDDGSGLTIFVAKKDGKVVGYVEPIIDEQNKHYISAIYVDPKNQGGGVGTKLYEKAVELLGEDQDIFLEVVSYNQKAIVFYKNKGFEQTKAIVPEDEGRPEYMKSLPMIEMVLKAKTDHTSL